MLYAPLYGIWYSVLARTSADATSLFYANYAVLTVLPPLLLFVMLRRYRVSVPTSSISAFVLLVASGNFPVLPKVNHFELCIFFATLTLASFPKKPGPAFAILAVGSLIASYARPEMFVGFVLIAIISLWIIAFRERSRSSAVMLVVIAIPSIAGFVKFGFPLAGGRDFTAFGQHFSQNWVKWTGNSSLSPWYDFAQITKLSFGESSTIAEAALENPSAFLHHVASNLMHLPRQALNALKMNAALFANIPGGTAVGHAVMALLIGCVLVAKRKEIAARFATRLRGQIRLLIGAGIMISVGIVSCIVIYPRVHYIFALTGLSLAVLAVLFDPFGSENPEPRRRRVAAAFAIALTVVAVTPNLGNAAAASRVPLPVLHAIDFIKTLDVNSDIHLLSQEFGYTTYVADDWGRPACNYERCGSWTVVHSQDKSRQDPDDSTKYLPFGQFRRDKAINMVLVTEGLLVDVRFRDDPEWHSFLARPEASGFVRFALPEGKQSLYVDRNVLNP